MSYCTVSGHMTRYNPRQGAKLNYTPSIQLLRRGGTSVYFLIRSGATFFTDWPGGNRFVALNTDRETRRHDTTPHVWRFAEIQYNVDSILLRFLLLLLLLRSSWRTVAKQVAYTVHSAISIRWWIMTMALICWGRPDWLWRWTVWLFSWPHKFWFSSLMPSVCDTTGQQLTGNWWRRRRSQGA